jgi:hypothetical protein
MSVSGRRILAEEATDDPLEFWTHDERQASAALSRGLAVKGTTGYPHV